MSGRDLQIRHGQATSSELPPRHPVFRKNGLRRLLPKLSQVFLLELDNDRVERIHCLSDPRRSEVQQKDRGQF